MRAKEWERKRKGKWKGGGGENWQTASCHFCSSERGLGLTSFESKAAKLYAKKWRQMTVFLWLVCYKEAIVSIEDMCWNYQLCQSSLYGIWEWKKNEMQVITNKIQWQTVKYICSSRGKCLIRRFWGFGDNDRYFWCSCCISSLCWRCIRVTLANDWWCTLSRHFIICFEQVFFSLARWIRFVSFRSSIC